MVQAMLRVGSLILAVLAAAGTVSAAFSEGRTNGRDSSLTVSLLHDDLGRIAQEERAVFPSYLNTEENQHPAPLEKHPMEGKRSERRRY